MNVIQPYQSLTQLFRRSERQFNPPIIPFKLWRLRMFKEMEPSHKGTFAASEAIEAMRKRQPRVVGCSERHPGFEHDWRQHDFVSVEADLKKASTLRPDFLFVSVYDLDDTMRDIYPPQTYLLDV